MSYSDLYEKAKRNGTLSAVSVSIKGWTTSGDELVGKMVDYQEIVSPRYQRPFISYTFETDEGYVSFALGASMDRIMAKDANVGKVFYILYKGKEQLQDGRSMHKFEIEELSNA